MPLTAEGRSARALKGAGNRWGRPELVEAADVVIRREQIDRKIDELVDAWPPLTPEQRARLTDLLSPVPEIPAPQASRPVRGI